MTKKEQKLEYRRYQFEAKRRFEQVRYILEKASCPESRKGYMDKNYETIKEVKRMMKIANCQWLIQYSLEMNIGGKTWRDFLQAELNQLTSSVQIFGQETLEFDFETVDIEDFFSGKLWQKMCIQQYNKL